MSGFELREAVASDVPSVERVVWDAYAPYVERMPVPPAPMTSDYRRLVESGSAWVLVRGETVIGFMLLAVRSRHVDVQNVAIARAYQGRKLGRMLLEHAEAEARRRSISELRLYTNELMVENQEIYRKLGWTEYDRSEQDGYQRVFMRKFI